MRIFPNSFRLGKLVPLGNRRPHIFEPAPTQPRKQLLVEMELGHFHPNGTFRNCIDTNPDAVDLFEQGPHQAPPTSETNEARHRKPTPPLKETMHHKKLAETKTRKTDFIKENSQSWNVFGYHFLRKHESTILTQHRRQKHNTQQNKSQTRKPMGPNHWAHSPRCLCSQPACALDRPLANLQVKLLRWRYFFWQEQAVAQEPILH